MNDYCNQNSNISFPWVRRVRLRIALTTLPLWFLWPSIYTHKQKTIHSLCLSHLYCHLFFCCIQLFDARRSCILILQSIATEKQIDRSISFWNSTLARNAFSSNIILWIRYIGYIKLKFVPNWIISFLLRIYHSNT